MSIKEISIYKKLLEGKLPKDHDLLTVKNPFSGVKSVMTPEEECVYSFIMGAQSMGQPSNTIWNQVNECLSWFRKHNPTVYMDQLD
tara:strand:+ start:206 stop:463 length:258 start_codon:yes stop_codon:yes gene_type:complete